MATSPAIWKDEEGRDRLVGFLEGDFGGLPTGWTQDASDPANVATNGGTLTLDDGTNEMTLLPGDFEVTSDTTDEFYEIGIGVGMKSTAPTGIPCFAAHDDASATVALDGGGLLLSNVVPDETIIYASTAAAAPTTFITPIYYDSTAVSGGLYAWNGSAYIQIGGLIA